MTAHTHDDAFHEIQLNGKQLVFLVMAATVVSVAIFLCGVLVGRNVRAERSAMMQAALEAQAPMADVMPTAPAATVPSVGQSEIDPRVVAPPPTVGDSDARHGDDAQTAAEVLKPAAPRAEVPTAHTAAVQVKSAERPAAKPVEKPQPKAAAPAPPPTVSASAKAAASAPPVAMDQPSAAGGYAVQVAALNVRGEADAIARRLTAKGYSAYVQAPSGGTPTVFRVRVGTFKTRREAESIATRLQKEEQFKPWVTR